MNDSTIMISMERLKIIPFKKIFERSFAYIIAGRTMTAKFSRPYRLARGKSWGASASQEKRSAPKP